MGPEKETDSRDKRVTSDHAAHEIGRLFDHHVNTVLSYKDRGDHSTVQEAAERVSQAIHADPNLYTDIQKGKALAGIARLALGTYEEGPALENAGRVSGLSRGLGAVVYSLSALYGPADNLYLISEGLHKIDRNLTASVLAEVALGDPSEDVRTHALQWLAHTSLSEAASLAHELSEVGALTPDMMQRLRGASATELIKDLNPVSILSLDDQQAVARILPAIQQILCGTDSVYRVNAVGLLAQERSLYAIPMLTLGAQVSDAVVREAALTALGAIDSETANSVREAQPSLVNRCVVDQANEEL